MIPRLQQRRFDLIGSRIPQLFLVLFDVAFQAPTPHNDLGVGQPGAQPFAQVAGVRETTRGQRANADYLRSLPARATDSAESISIDSFHVPPSRVSSCRSISGQLVRLVMGGTAEDAFFSRRGYASSAEDLLLGRGRLTLTQVFDYFRVARHVLLVGLIRSSCSRSRLR